MAYQDEEQLTELVKSLHVFAEGEVRWAKLVRRFNKHLPVATPVDRVAHIPKPSTEQSPAQWPEI